MSSAPSGYPIEGRREDLSTEEIDLKPKFSTVVPKGTTRRGLDVVSGGYYEINDAGFYVAEAGSTASRLVVTGHDFLEHDLVRIVTTANGIREVELFIERIIDANTVLLTGAFSAQIAIGDEIEVLRFITEKVAPDGSSLTTITAAPVRIARGSGGVYVDTPITKDLTVPSNTVGMPVEIVAAGGTEVNITAGDINVQTSRIGVNHDSMRIGNQDVEQAYTDLGGGIGASRVEDLLSLTELQAILAKIIAAPSTEAKQDVIITALGVLDTELKLKADLTETQPVSLASVPLPTGSATEAKQDVAITALGLLTTPSDTQPISALALPLPAGASTEVTLAAVLADLNLKADLTETQPTSAVQLPATLGQKIAADSLGVTQSAEDLAVQTAIKDALEASLLANTIDVRAGAINDNSATPITAAGVTIIADIGTKACTEIKITCTFGNYMDLLINGVAKAFVPKGGFSDGALKVAIPANASVGFRRNALEVADISDGQIIINVMG